MAGFTYLSFYIKMKQISISKGEFIYLYQNTIKNVKINFSISYILIKNMMKSEYINNFCQNHQIVVIVVN